MRLPLAHELPTTTRPEATGPLVDAQGRRITYLRLSITDTCNFRCGYCSPAHWDGRASLLTAGELSRLARLFVGLGVERIRLTGGEPLLRADLVELAASIAAIPGLRELCLTTNGHHLERLAAPLASAGVSRVNVSLDSLDEPTFRRLTKTGELGRVLRGLEAAAGAGFSRLGVNAVVVAGENDDAPGLARLTRHAWSIGAVPRFIELMPFAGGASLVPIAEVRKRLETQGIRITRTDTPTRAGPATYGHATDEATAGGEIGFIGAMTENFCDRCNRVRIAARGDLRACLGGREGAPLGTLLRTGASDAALEDAIRSTLAGKATGHRFLDDGPRGLLPMMGVGG